MRRSAEAPGPLDAVSLAVGIGVIALGVTLLLDQSGTIELTFGWLGAIVAALAGTALLISGLRDSEPHAPGTGESTAGRAEE